MISLHILGVVSYSSRSTMQNPMQAKDNSKDWWENRYQSQTPYLYPKEPSSFLLEFVGLLPEKAQAIDLGCGEGHNAVALALKGHQVRGIDFSETALNRAEDLAKASGLHIEFRKADLDFFIPDLMSFDAIFCIDMKPSPTLMKNMLRGLRKDGMIFIEAHLVKAMKKKKELELFECFKPGELLKHWAIGPNFRVVYYNELKPDLDREKVQIIIQKTEML